MAGLSHEWAYVPAGDTITCPGTKADRRAAQRGDRRVTPRPCTHRWGRASDGVWVRVRVVVDGVHARVAVRPDGFWLATFCPECRQTVEFLVLAERPEAA